MFPLFLVELTLLMNGVPTKKHVSDYRKECKLMILKFGWSVSIAEVWSYYIISLCTSLSATSLQSASELTGLLLLPNILDTSFAPLVSSSPPFLPYKQSL